VGGEVGEEKEEDRVGWDAGRIPGSNLFPLEWCRM